MYFLLNSYTVVFRHAICKSYLHLSNKRANHIIVAACKADQYGWDYLNLVNTLYFYYFGDFSLLRNNADSIESAHVYAYPFVVAEQPDSQPQLYNNYPGEFYL